MAHITINCVLNYYQNIYKKVAEALVVISAGDVVIFEQMKKRKK